MDLVAKAMPKKVLARVKRYMRRDIRKPHDMPIREFYQHIMRMNEMELTALPPYQAGQKFNDDELIDNILWGIPKSWQREMDRQGFDAYAVNAAGATEVTRMIDFCEQIETAESHDEEQNTHVSKKKGNSSSKKDSNKSKGDDGKGKVYCEKHGWNYTHATDECRVLNGEKRQKYTNDKKPYGHKKWNRKHSESKTDDSKKELAAFIKKQVAKGVRKELNTASKKRKSDSDDELDLNALEKDLDDFNYDDMDNLKIDSDDDSEVST